MASSYVTPEEVRDGVGIPIRPDSYPDLERYRLSAESRVRVQLGNLPDRTTEDGEFVASIIRDLAISRYLLGTASNAALVEKGRALREQALESLLVYANNADTPDAPPDTITGPLEITGGLALFTPSDYPDGLS